MKRKKARLLLLGLALAWPACGRTPAGPYGPAPASSSIPPTPPENEVPLLGLVLDGLFFPLDQFRATVADACDDTHWHMRGAYVVSIGGLDGRDDITCHAAGGFVFRGDPDAGRCGFGKVPQVRMARAAVSRACYDLWLSVAPS